MFAYIEVFRGALYVYGGGLLGINAHRGDDAQGMVMGAHRRRGARDSAQTWIGISMFTSSALAEPSPRRPPLVFGIAFGNRIACEYIITIIIRLERSGGCAQRGQRKIIR